MTTTPDSGQLSGEYRISTVKALGRSKAAPVFEALCRDYEMNIRPRKRFGFKCPIEVMTELMATYHEAPASIQ